MSSYLVPFSFFFFLFFISQAYSGKEKVLEIGVSDRKPGLKRNSMSSTTGKWWDFVQVLEQQIDMGWKREREGEGWEEETKEDLFRFVGWNQYHHYHHHHRYSVMMYHGRLRSERKPFLFFFSSSGCDGKGFELLLLKGAFWAFCVLFCLFKQTLHAQNSNPT
jgi:hypothetical protein